MQKQFKNIPDLIANLRKIHIKECGEPLVPANIYDRRITYTQMAKRVKHCRLVRTSVAKKLALAQNTIGSSYRFCLACGYRTKNDQFKLIISSLKSKPVTAPFPLLQDIEPPHTTGGVIDVILQDRYGRRNIDFKRNRIAFRLFKSALRAAGFINLSFEWWHWSYGDRYWALHTGRKTTKYGPRLK